MDHDFIKELLETDIFLMDRAALGLETARENLVTADWDVKFWKDSVEFWEQALDESIELLKETYHRYLKS